MTHLSKSLRIAMAGALALLLGACAHDAGGGRDRVLLKQDNIQVDVIAEGRGPTIVLLPSSQRDSEDFDELARLIAAEGFRVLRPQPRGMHGSTGPMEQLSLHDLANDVKLAVDRLGAGRAVLVGHAYGHFTARVADMNHPAMVRGVVVLGASQRQISQELIGKLNLASDPTKPREQRLKALQEVMFAPGNDASSWLDGWHPKVRAAYRGAAQRPGRDVWWPVANAPILDLQGDSDPWRPASSRNELKEKLGDKITVKVIPRASHALIPEQPKAVAQAIVEWVRTLKP
jgi:pimeloyl-ACP methyl ester carboxylesterase